MLRNRQTLLIAVLVVLTITLATKAEYRDNSKAIKVSGGEDHTLVLTADKGAWACGPNGGYAFQQYYYGVLGTGSEDWSLNQKTLVRVHDGAMGTESDRLEDINDIDAGWMHSLALDVDGFLWSWGWNSEGQLGIGLSGPEAYSTTPVQVLRGEQAQDPCQPSDYLKHIVAISAGRSGEFSLAVDANNLVYAWGMNQEGQLGNGQHGAGVRELTPVKVKGVNGQGHLQNVIVVSGGADHSMALEELDPFDPNRKGRVYTWGSNKWPGDGEKYQPGSGKLGNRSTVDLSDTPVRVLAGQQDPNDPNAFLKNIVAISAGWNHCIALEKDDPFEPNYKGRVYTWGSNGQGYGNYQDPCSIGGRLGDGTTSDSNTPVLVLSGEQDPCSATSVLEHIIAVSAGEAHSMALDVDGYVYTWGDNYHGQLGDGTNDQRLVPVRVVGQDRNRNGIHDANEGYLENIVAISAGYWHGLAIDANGTIWTWGKGSAGRLGLGNKTIDCNTPNPIPVVYNVTQETFALAIQTAIDDANDAGDTLEASPGTYYENVNFGIKALTLQSQAGNFDVVSSTVIDGSYAWSSAVSLYGNPGSTLAGFTITNSYQHGIYEYACSGASVIRNNIIRGNIENGIYCHQFSYGSDIKNNWIYDNGGNGIETCNPNAPLANAVIVNNTIINNDANGVNSDYAADVNITNCIIWDNGNDANDNLYARDSATFDVSYTCVEYDTNYPGTGNINGDPCFVDDVNDDYHLTWGSLCVDKGDSSAVVDANEKDIDGNPREMGPVDPNDPNGHLVDMGADEDFPHCDQNYPAWVSFGRPNCWMWPYQCDGDADGINSGVPYYYRVYTGDIALINQNWRKKMGDPTLNPCADIDHISSGAPYYYRVYIGDISKVIANWRKKDAGLRGDCANRGCQRGALGCGSPGTQLTGKELLNRLAEIWLDPEVRKSIDEEKFLEVYESLKGL